MRQIRIEGSHPAYTPSQLRAVISWVLRKLEIPASASSKWSVALGVSRRGYSGQGGGGCAILRFTTLSLPSEKRALDLVHLAAHELWHNEQHRRYGWRWPRTASGRRKNMEPGARMVEADVVAAFHADEDALLARWGFERGVLLPAPVATPARTPEEEAVRAAVAALRVHYVDCPICNPSWGYENCPEARALVEARDAARSALRASKAAAARARAVEASRVAVATKAERRERRVRAKLAEWERKLKAAQAKVREYRTKVRYYDRKADRLAAASGSPETAARGPASSATAAPAPAPVRGVPRGAEEDLG